VKTHITWTILSQNLRLSVADRTKHVLVQNMYKLLLLLD